MRAIPYGLGVFPLSLTGARRFEKYVRKAMPEASLSSLLKPPPAGASPDANPVTVRVMVSDRQVKPTRSGGEFSILSISDSTGSAEAKDFARAAADLPVPCVADVSLVAEMYQGNVSLVAKDARPAPGPIDPMDFLPFDRVRVAADRAAIIELIHTLSPGPYTALVKAALAPVFDDFCLWPAEARHHHNYPGGLLQHTLEVARYALGLADLDADPYDRDLLLTAALLHDIGKLDEYERPPLLRRSAAGELAYHLAHGQVRLGIAVAHARASGEEIPDAVKFRLCHCIEQSHGAYRLDTARSPVGKEVKCLAAADDHSAKRAPREAEIRLQGELR